MRTSSLYRLLRRRFNSRSAETRRDFVKSTLGIGTAALLSQQGNSNTPKPARRILIVGAGLSGLACAHELTSAGYRVTVAEARNRVGGRVLSFRDFVPSLVVEGGGELVGENHPTWWAYAEKFGLELVEIDDDEDLDSPLVLDGHRVDARTAEKVYRETETAFYELAEQAKPIDADQPWLSPNARKLDAVTIAEWIAGSGVSKQAQRLMAIQLGSDNAVACEKGSLLGLLAMIAGGGGADVWELSETHRCKSGTQSLATKLAESLDAGNLLLNKAVHAIDTSGTLAVVHFADGTSREFDDVVLAVPPSVWPKIQFTPRLPDYLKPQMGTAIKYLAAVDERFWLDDDLSPESTSDGIVSQTWEAMNSNRGSKTPTVLIGFSGGPQAEACLKIPTEQRDRRFEEAFYPMYPGFGEHFQKSRMMSWPKDEWTLGGYSFPAPGQITRIGPTLRHGIGSLHFAGEHTCYAFVGYMEGALKSGVDLARRIAGRDGVIDSASD